MHCIESKENKVQEINYNALVKWKGESWKFVVHACNNRDLGEKCLCQEVHSFHQSKFVYNIL